MLTLTLYLFGPPRLEINGRTVQIQRRKVMALLAYLAVTRREQSRESLSAFLWPEYGHQKARADLRRTLSQLQKALNGHFLRVTGDTIAFSLESAWVDVHWFQEMVSNGRNGKALAQAVALYRGSFLAGFTLRDSPAFDEWQARENDTLRLALIQALRRLIEIHETGLTFEEAIRYGQQWVAVDELNEACHRRLMQLYARSGRRSDALRQYKTCAHLLQTELGVEPEPETVTLYEEIKAYEKASTRQPGENESKPVIRPAPHNLPPQLTPFIGREAELGRLLELLTGNSYRLITVVGEGGVGKTRLALAAATKVRAGFADGVWFIPLAGLVTDNVPEIEEEETAVLENMIAVTTAAALGLTFAPGQAPKTQLRNHLRTRHCLLLLDNFEPLVSGAGLINDLLVTAPGVTLLITSREPLRFQAEYLLRLEGMPVPDDPATDDFTGYDSLKLFAERVERVAGQRFINNATLADVIRICRFMGGLPLGIELAAGWVRWLSPAQILTTLRENAGALESELRDGPARHRNLQAVFEYSWQLLSAEERSVLAKISVFRRVFHLEAAVAITGASYTAVFTLVDKSLLQRLANGYFGLHDLLRHFADGKLRQLSLDQNVLRDRLRDRHATYYLDFIGGQDAALNGRAPLEALQDVQINQENLRQAWQWAVTRPLPAALARGLGGMASYWGYAGLFQEGEDALRRAVTRLETLNSQASELPHQQLLAHLHSERVGLTHEWRPPEETLQSARQAITLAERSDDGELLAGGYLRLANVLWRMGKFEEAAAACKQGLAFVQSLDLPLVEAMLWRNLAAAVWRLGDRERAWSCALRSLELHHRVGDIRGQSRTRYLLGILALNRHDYAEARQIFDELLRLSQEIGDRRLEISARESLGQIAAYQGEFETALAGYEKAQRMARELGILSQTANTLSNLGDLKLRLGDYNGARALYEEARQIFQQLGARSFESNVLAFWGLLCSFTAEYETGKAFCLEALALAEATGAQREQAFARLFLAHNLLGLGEEETAAVVYRQALQEWQLLGEQSRALEAQAGLARAILAGGDTGEALSQVETIMPHLTSGSLDGADDPVQVYLSCYAVLRIVQDARAEATLQAAWRLLQGRAGRIQDITRRRTFLHNVPSHGTLMRLRADQSV